MDSNTMLPRISPRWPPPSMRPPPAIWAGRYTHTALQPNRFPRANAKSQVENGVNPRIRGRCSTNRIPRLSERGSVEFWGGSELKELTVKCFSAVDDSKFRGRLKRGEESPLDSRWLGSSLRSGKQSRAD